MRLNTKSLKFKIILYTTLCVAITGVVSNLIIYQYLNTIILEKADGIDTLYLNNLQIQIDTNLQDTLNLMLLCSNDVDIAYCLGTGKKEDSIKNAREILRVQKIMNTYLKSCNTVRYIRRLIAFNESGLSIHAETTAYGNLTDVEQIMESSLFKNRNSGADVFSELSESIHPPDGKCLAALFSVSNPSVAAGNSYIYVEVSTEVVTDILTPYAQLNNIFVTTRSGDTIGIPGREEQPSLSSEELHELSSSDIVRSGDSTYKIHMKKLQSSGLTLFNCVNISELELDSQKITYTVCITILTSVLVGTGLLIMISTFITRPIRHLITRIKKISQNDFSYDPEIERSRDEIGEIGRVVNEMSVSIQRLLDETIENSVKQKDIEIALLQSQVNPHFLYNTLDSIHWMAVIQKNPGICNMTRSLTNLLKNMSKGFSGKITLAQELSLLNDYTTIQSIRYLETFELVDHIDPRYHSYKIIKMTLQPIVENAIFHGIEPTGNCGIITLDAYDDDEYLYVTVQDNGVGMTPEETQELMERSKQGTKDTMNGIGMANVDARLKMIYGKECGLSIESIKGEFTRVTIKIRKEV